MGLTAGKKAARTKKHKAAGAKDAATRKHRAAGKKAAQTRKRRAAGKRRPLLRGSAEPLLGRLRRPDEQTAAGKAPGRAPSGLSRRPANIG